MVISIIVFILILGFLVFSHEFGHFIVAKKSGVKVEEFGLGYPPRIFSVKKGETVYSINAIPFGGFVRLYGEEKVTEKHFFDPRSFASQPIFKKVLIISAGVLMNFLIAVFIFYFLLFSSNFTDFQILVFDYHFPFGSQRQSPMVTFVAKNSPAEKAGILQGDVILKANNHEVKSTKELINFVNSHKGKEILLELKNSKTGNTKEVKVIPRQTPPEGEGPLGIGIVNLTEISYKNPLQKTFSGFLHSLNLAHYSITAFCHLIGKSIKEETIKPLSTNIIGPVGILAVTKVTITAGLKSVFQLIGLVSLALAIMNLLPFPALDGGRLVFVAIEGIVGKRIPPKVENAVNYAGFLILIFLLILITFKDINQFKDILLNK